MSLILVYASLMRGKSGHWGKPFTKGNANAMRLRGLEIRRSISADRLASKLRRGEAIEQARQAWPAGPEPSQPSSPPRPDAAEQRPAIEAKPASTDTAPMAILQPGEKICYGYEIAPGVFVDAKPPARNPNGLTEAAVLCAQRMARRRWDGKPL